METANKSSIERQNAKLLKLLQSGSTIHFIAAQRIGIPFLHSRIADIRRDNQVHSRWITIGEIRCKEYSFKPFI